MKPALLKLNSWFPTVTGICTFILVLFVGLVTYDTLKTFTNVEMDDPMEIHAWNNDIGLVVAYRRGFTIKTAGYGVVQRIVKCPIIGDEKYYLEGDLIHKSFEEGYHPPMLRPVQFPMNIPVGTDCVLETWGEWRPRFSISSKRFLLDTIPFKVHDHALQ